MKAFLFLLAVGVVLALLLAGKTAWGQGLIDDARQWWKLRSMQAAAAIALVPQFVGIWADYFGNLWPQAQSILMQVLPGTTQNALTIAGAVFAFYRLVRQSNLPRWPSFDDVESADK